MGIPDVASLALIAPDSVSYSTNAIPFLPGTNLASVNPSNRPNTLVSVSWSMLSGRSRKNRILFGGRYSSGMTVAAAPLVGLRPAPLVVLAGRVVSGAAPAGRLSFFWASRASWACLRSVCRSQPPHQIPINQNRRKRKQTLLSQPPPLMRLQLITTTLSQNRRIAPRLRIIQDHRLLK